MKLDFHPCQTGDLPKEIQLRLVFKHIGLSERSIYNHWRDIYPWVVRNKHGLFVLIQECDSWLDSRGKPLLSTVLIKEKKLRNPGWTPISESIGFFDQLTSRIKANHEL